jgi:hypothetical protein
MRKEDLGVSRTANEKKAYRRTEIGHALLFILPTMDITHPGQTNEIV